MSATEKPLFRKRKSQTSNRSGRRLSGVSPTDAPTPPSRHRGPRPVRGLRAGQPSVVPSTRAALGALLCLLAGLLTYLAIDRSNRPPTTHFAVAHRDLAPGEVLSESDVESVTMDLPSGLRSRAVEGDLGALKGVTVLGPVAAGELLQRGMLVRRATSASTFSFPIQAEFALGGRLRSGSRVDLYGTEGDKTTLVAGNALVVRTDGTAAVRGSIVVTIALDGGIDQRSVVAAASQNKLAIVEVGAEQANSSIPLSPPTTTPPSK